MQAIFVSAGHGKSPFGLKDVGAVGRFGNAIYIERDFAKEIAGRVIQILHSKEELKGCLIQGVGIETEASIIRKMAYVNTTIRENRFNPNKCLGIAIHMNGSASNKPRGFEVWYQKKNNLSSQLGQHLVDSWGEYNLTPLRPRPVNSSKWSRYGRFYIDDALCPYVIIETGFISNLDDVLSIKRHFDRVAEAIAHGLLQFTRSLK